MSIFQEWWQSLKRVPTELSVDYFPKHCCVCGSKLLLIEEPNGFWEDNGEPRFYCWLKCPNWKKGRTMFLPGAFISYTALELDREQKKFVPMFGYTRYQTCNETIVY